MNNITKNALIFSAGAILGAIIASLLTKNHYEELVEDELQDIRETAAARKIDIVRGDLAGAAAKAGLSLVKNEDVFDTGCLTRENSKILVMNQDKYKKVARTYGDILTDVEEDLNNRALKYAPKDDEILDDPDPYIIDIEQFSEEMDEFDKLTIYFYRGDDVLADEEEEIIIDEKSIIGKEALKLCMTDFVDSELDEMEVIYVRNERLAIDYEIICIEKSFAEPSLFISSGEEIDEGSDSDDDETPE